MGSVGGVLGSQNVPVPIKQKIQTNWQNRKVEILSSFGMAVLGIVLIAAAILPILGIFLTAIGFASGMFNLLKPIPGSALCQITPGMPKAMDVVETEDTGQVRMINCPFDLRGTSIDEAQKKITVTVGYAAGNRKHDFKLYYSSKLKEEDRNIPGKVWLIHNNHGEPAEAYAFDRLVIDLNRLDPLIAYHITNWAKENKHGRGDS
ncbi:MAG: hypothetical protein V4487_04110 [Chlamydiota bacterium]